MSNFKWKNNILKLCEKIDILKESFGENKISQVGGAALGMEEREILEVEAEVEGLKNKLEKIKEKTDKIDPDNFATKVEINNLVTRRNLDTRLEGIINKIDTQLATKEEVRNFATNYQKELNQFATKETVDKLSEKLVSIESILNDQTKAIETIVQLIKQLSG